MNSNDYRRLAQTADDFGYTIIALFELQTGEGVYPGARCVLHNPDRPESRAYAVSLGVLPYDHKDDDAAFFCSTRYDLSRARAYEVLSQQMAMEANDLLEQALLEGIEAP